jgi:hypothetical protein
MVRVHRTIDTRIFNPAESPVRREQGEDRERIFDGPTEPPSATEPIPNLGRGVRPNSDRTAYPVVKRHLSVYDDA